MQLARVLTGIYDDPDLNDVVVAVASATGLVESSGLCAKPVDAAAGTVRPHLPVLDARTLSATLSILRVEGRSPRPCPTQPGSTSRRHCRPSRCLRGSAHEGRS